MQDTYSKNIREGATRKQSTSKKKKRKGKDKKLLVICSDTRHTQIPRHVTTSQLNIDKIQITGFRETRDNRTRNLRTDSSKKSQ